MIKMEIKLDCDEKVAYSSPDHITPIGTMQDSSKNPRFNRKIYKLFSKTKNNLNILDLGCSGGGFVRDCVNDGCFAIGLEGSDYSQEHKRSEWAIIPEFLFTCNIAKRFKLLKNGNHVKFNVITAWEVLEHINTKEIDTLIKNIKDNMSDDGIFVGSVANCPSGSAVELHQTQKPKEWWINKFENHGLFYRGELLDYFNKQYVRGREQNDINFHIIFSKRNIEFDNIKLDWKEKVKDYWIGNKVQCAIEFLVNGVVMAGK